jgi:hypothetical protein
MVRPTFEYQNQPVKAAGLLVWTESKGKKWTLFRKYKGKWADMGGKTDTVDNSILDTVVREVCEETNNSLFCTNDEDCASKVRNIIERHSSKMFYDAKCKYLLFYCKVDASLLAAPLSRFGEAEGSKKHEYQWVTSVPQPLNFRLRGFRRRL